VTRYIQTFTAQWPDVLGDMKDFVDLSFLAIGTARKRAIVRIFISKALVEHTRLQPHVQRFRASIAQIPQCLVEVKSTREAAHKIEIEYER
jgi:hypothetical protein